MESHKDTYIHERLGALTPFLLTHTPIVHLINYLIRVVHQGTVVAVIAHAIPVCVSLVGVVDVGTIVPLVEDVCRCSGKMSVLA